ncbi:MAG: hypothetical protein R3F34_18885 [Planctomycetota bacterium]
MALVHELSWSVSRDGMLSECARRYYLTYYLAWKGWEWRAPEERKRAYALKKLERLPTWAGAPCTSRSRTGSRGGRRTRAARAPRT